MTLVANLVNGKEIDLEELEPRSNQDQILKVHSFFLPHLIGMFHEYPCKASKTTYIPLSKGKDSAFVHGKENISCTLILYIHLHNIHTLSYSSTRQCRNLNISLKQMVMEQGMAYKIILM